MLLSYHSEKVLIFVSLVKYMKYLLLSCCLLLIATSVILLSSCNNDPGFSDAPEIEFVSMSKDTLVQGNAFSDSILIKFNFKDGDGDLGVDRSVTQNISLTDRRTMFDDPTFKIPPLPIGGGQTGIEGTITVKVYTTCCIFPDGTPPCLNPSDFPENELSYDIVLTDDSGNASNVITTPSLVLLCQ